MRLASPRSLLALCRRVASGTSTPEREAAATRERALAGDPAIAAFVRFADPVPPGAAASGPLAGVSLGVKDIFDTADLATEHGSPIYRDARPRADAPLVAAARLAGATVLGKTATTEFAFLEPCATRNPHDTRRTPGGSSSGSAAAVAAGLFAAGVRDVAMLAAALSRRVDLAIDETETTASALTIGLYRSAIDQRADAAMHGARDEAARLLERAGARLIDIPETPDLAAARDAQPILQLFEGAQSLLSERTRHAALLSPLLREALEAGGAIEPACYDRARRAARTGRRAATALFERCDVLLVPSATGAAPRTRTSTGDPLFNRLWTLTGNPCVNVPGFADAEAMPLGLTVVARFGRDPLALAAASLLEELAARR